MGKNKFYSEGEQDFWFLANDGCYEFRGITIFGIVFFLLVMFNQIKSKWEGGRIIWFMCRECRHRDRWAGCYVKHNGQFANVAFNWLGNDSLQLTKRRNKYLARYWRWLWIWLDFSVITNENNFVFGIWIQRSRKEYWNWSHPEFRTTLITIATVTGYNGTPNIIL